MPHFGSRNHRRMALGLLVGSALSACLPAQAGAHGGYRVFPIAELTDEMLEQIQLDDGSVAEWFDLVDEPTMSLADFRWYGHIPDPSDLDFRIWLAWHDEPDRLYVAFTASDDAHIIYDGTLLSKIIRNHPEFPVVPWGKGLSETVFQDQVCPLSHYKF